MRKYRILAIATGLAVAGGFAATPALADVGFRIDLGPPAYYAPPPPPPPAYYYYPSYRYYYD